MKLSVVTPLYNSAPYIEELCRRSVEAISATGADDYEIILVNDGGPDDSLAVAKRVAERNPHVTVIDLSRNFGQHRALMTGLDYATGDLIFIMDSDLEEEPEWIASFHRELVGRDCDVVFGVSAVRKGGRLYSLSRKLFYRTLNFLSSVDFPVNVCTARLMTRRYVDALLQFTERELFFSGVLHVTGFLQLPVAVEKHDSSPTNYNFWRLVRLFVNSVTAFSTRPLVLIGVTGILISLFAIGYCSVIVFRALVFGIAVPGWASVMAATLLIGGLSIFFSGINAIYISKIFIEVKQRPQTIIRDIHRQSSTLPKKSLELSS